jgi:hypothetical protein
MHALPCVVYWLFDDACRDPATDGYIGSSQRLLERLVYHLNNPDFPFVPALKFKILFRGSKRECHELEGKLRPVPGIGWNRGTGIPGHRFRKQNRPKNG